MRAAAAFPFLLAALPAAGAPTDGASGTVVLRGRLIDGSAMVRSVPPDALHSLGHVGEALKQATRAPLPERRFKIHIVDGPGSGKTVEGRSDPDGRFSVNLDLPEPPPARSLVAAADDPAGGAPLFSPAVSWSGDEIEFRCYAVTSDEESLVESQAHVFHSLVPNAALDRKDLQVEVQLVILNVGSDAFIGKPLPGEAGGPRRIFRVPVPAGASIVLNSGPEGAVWTEAAREGKWTWMAVDRPIFPLLEQPRGGVWELHYRVPARQEMAFLYPLDLGLSQLAAWSPAGEIALESPALSFDANPKSPRPIEKRNWTVNFAQQLKSGRQVPLGLHVDNALLGEMNRGTVLLLLCLFLPAVAAIVLGLLLGRREPRLEAVLEEATGDEVIARIAALDGRFERGEVPEKEYRETRAKLVSMARYLVPELGADEGRKEGS